MGIGTRKILSDFGGHLYPHPGIFSPRSANAVGNAFGRVCLYVCVCMSVLFKLELLKDNLNTSSLVRDAFVRTNRRAIAIMFVRLCIVIIQCTLAFIV